MIDALVSVFHFFGEIIRDPIILAFMFGGSFIGILFGAIPGLTATTAVILLIPMTYYMRLDLALITLLSIFKGGMFGGSISSILLGIPGSPGAVATAIDGYPLGQEGKGNKATLMALFASVTGDTVTDIFTVLLAPMIGLLAISIGPPELFIIIIVCLLAIGSMTGKFSDKETNVGKFSKAAISGLLGIIVVFVGMEPIVGTARFTFGSFQLLGGFPLVPVFLGMFALSRAISLMVEPSDLDAIKKVHLTPPKKPEDAKCTFKEYLFCIKAMAYGTAVGAVMGMAPGLGPNAAGLIAHANGQNFVKEKEKYGKGALEGVALAESANSAVYGANLLPLVTIGIPGSAEAAVLMGAFLLHGIHIGPLLIINHPEIIYKMFAGMILANVATLVVGFVFIPVYVKAITVPRNILFPIIMVMCFIGSFSETPRIFFLFVVIIFGIIGYFMDKMGLSVAALCIGFILGNYAEASLNKSMIIAKGSIFNLLQRPALIVVLIILAVLIASLWMTMNRRKRLISKSGKSHANKSI